MIEEEILNPEKATPQKPNLEQRVEPQPYNQVSQEPYFQNDNESFLSTRNILKILIGFFAVVAVVFILFVFVIPNVGKGNQKIVLSYWGAIEDSSVMQPVIADFEKQNPNITVEYTKQDIKDYQDKLITRLSQGTGPDIFSIQNTWESKFSPFLLPLPTEVISKNDFNSSFYPVMQKDLIRNGGIYGIPLGIDTLSLFVNTDLLKQTGLGAPKNWDDFISAARSLTVKDQSGKITTSGASIGTFDNVTHAGDIISMLLVQDGVDLNSLSLSRDRVADALRFYTGFAQGDSNVWDSTLDSSLLAFIKGNAAMYFGYYWDYFSIKSQSPALQFEVDPVPSLNFRKQTIASYWAEGVSGKSRNQKEALLFMKFLARKDTQQKLYSQEAKVRIYGEPPSIPALSGLLNGPLSAIPAQAKNATSSYFGGVSPDKNLSSFLSGAVNSILNGGSPESAADNLISGVSQVFSPSPK